MKTSKNSKKTAKKSTAKKSVRAKTKPKAHWAASIVKAQEASRKKMARYHKALGAAKTPAAQAKVRALFGFGPRKAALPVAPKVKRQPSPVAPVVKAASAEPKELALKPALRIEGLSESTRQELIDLAINFLRAATR